MQREFGEYDGLIRWAHDLELTVKETWTPHWWKARINYYESRQ